MHWPIKGVEELAWSPSIAELAVPLLPQEKRLDYRVYLDRLQTRIDWMAQQTQENEGTPAEEIYEQTWDNLLGRFPNSPLRNLASSTDLAEIVLSENDAHPWSKPRAVESDPEMVESIQELWHLGDWLTQVIPTWRE